MSSSSAARNTASSPVQVIVEEITSPPPPFEAFKRIAHLPRAIFLDSVHPHKRYGRYSFITAEPFEFIIGREDKFFVVTRHGKKRLDDIFAYIGQALRSHRAPLLEELPPFQGGVAGIFAYDLAHQVERLERPRYDEFRVPEVALGMYDWVLSYDLVKERAWLVALCLSTQEEARQERIAREKIARIRRLVLSTNWASEVASPGSREVLRTDELAPEWVVPDLKGLVSNFSKEAYLKAIEKALEYIYAGDIFQVNISQRLLYPWRENPLPIYERLRGSSSALFGGYFDMGKCLVLSSSPERFILVQGQKVETRPIKGTRPRGESPAQDRAIKAELSANPKDRAENVMIVDLLRNDISKVCVPGSVKVEELFKVETTPYVHHMVSTVTGLMEPEKTAADLLKACFPGGSVTGAPKVRAMEIIAELEPTARGPYCGCMGYIGFAGAMDTNILIRTVTLARGWMQFPVGGGIVAQSSPELEYEETIHKAQGIARAL